MVAGESRSVIIKELVSYVHNVINYLHYCAHATAVRDSIGKWLVATLAEIQLKRALLSIFLEPLLKNFHGGQTNNSRLIS
jgi:hypothetical protein